MGSKSARRTIIFLMVLTVGGTLLRRATSPNIPKAEILRPRLLIGALIAAVVLLIISERATKLATGLAVVMAITAVLAPNELEQGNAVRAIRQITPPSDRSRVPPNVR